MLNPCEVSIDWGSVPGWIEALATVMAIVLAAFAFRSESRKRDRDRRRLIWHMRSSAASLVSASYESSEEGLHLVVTNVSQRPIFDLSVEYLKPSIDGPQQIARSLLESDDRWRVLIADAALMSGAHAGYQGGEFAVDFRADQADWRLDQRGRLSMIIEGHTYSEEEWILDNRER